MSTSQMPPDHSADVKFEIGHVLFVDIVGYSKWQIHEQSELQRVNEVVRGTEQSRVAKKSRETGSITGGRRDCHAAKRRSALRTNRRILCT